MRATDMKYRDLPPNGFTLLENRVALTSKVQAAMATGDQDEVNDQVTNQGQKPMTLKLSGRHG